MKMKKFAPMIMGAAMAFTFAQAVDMPAQMEAQVPGIVISKAQAAANAVKSWDFSQNVGGWAFIGGWSYSGDAAVSYASDFGGSMKVDLDYSYDKDQSWSEVKLADGSVTNESPIVVGDGAGTITFDMYYDPAQITGDGMLKIKAYGADTEGEEVINQIVDDIGQGKDVPGSKYKKTSVKIILDDVVTTNIGHLELSIVSYLTGYQGAIYINNLQIK